MENNLEQRVKEVATLLEEVLKLKQAFRSSENPI